MGDWCPRDLGTGDEKRYDVIIVFMCYVCMCFFYIILMLLNVWNEIIMLLSFLFILLLFL